MRVCIAWYSLSSAVFDRMTHSRQCFALIEPKPQSSRPAVEHVLKPRYSSVLSPSLCRYTRVFSFRLSLAWPCQTSHLCTITVDIITPHWCCPEDELSSDDNARRARRTTAMVLLSREERDKYHPLTITTTYFLRREKVSGLTAKPSPARCPVLKSWAN